MTRHILTLSFILFILLSNTAYSQEVYTLSGRIKDGETGENLIGAKVFSKEINEGTITNVYGFYSLKLPKGQHILSLQSFGYLTKYDTLNMSGNITKTYTLDILTSETKEIVVTSERYNENVTSTHLGKVELTNQQIKTIPYFLGESNIIRSLLLTPGITSVSDLATGFHVRGGGSDQNLIILDNAIIFNPTHMFGLFSFFNNDAIKSATIYKTLPPIELGSRVSSFLDIRQKDGNNRKVSGRFSLGTLAAKALIEGPLGSEKGSFIVTGRYAYVGLLLNLLSDQNLTLYFYDVSAKLNYTFDKKNKIYLSFYKGADVYEFPVINNRTVYFSYGNTSATLMWNHLFRPDLFADIMFSYSNYFSTAQANLGFTFTSGNNDNNMGPDILVDLSQNFSTYALRGNFTYVLSNNMIIKSGIDASVYTLSSHKLSSSINISEIEGSPAQIPILDSQVPTQYSIDGTIYTGIEQSVTSFLDLEYGIRFNTFWAVGPGEFSVYKDNRPVKYDPESGVPLIQKPLSEKRKYAPLELIKFFYGVSPRTSARLLLTDETSIKAGYSWLRQNIHLLSSTTIGLPIDYWHSSDLYSSPQTSHNFSLGIYQNFLYGAIEISAEGFFRFLNNKLETIEGGTIFLNESIETVITQTDGRAYGLEIFFRKKKSNTNTAFDNLTGTLSYTYSIAEFKYPESTNAFTFQRYDYYPAFYDRTHIFTGTISYTVNKWAFSATYTYQTNIPVTPYTGTYLLADPNSSYNKLKRVEFYGFEKNKYRLSDYSRLDVSISVDVDNFPWDNATTTFNISVINTLSNFNTLFVNPKSSSNTANINYEERGLFTFPIPSISAETAF